ncbi:MAG: hypothetical protein ACYSUC_04850 [Planctomycetota bacterium]|jgi:hypothetical protein
MSTPNKQLSQWLFNPFKFIAGGKALLLGLAIILISGLLGSAGKTHFDGVLDVHTGLEVEAPLWCFLAEGLVNWICMAVPLFFFGLTVSSSAPRFIDVFGTQALARWPYLITAVVMLPDANRRFGEYLMSQLGQSSAPKINSADAVIFIVAAIIGVLMIIWMVALMYRAYSVSCNVKGPKAIITFILSLIGAEVLSKFIILRLIT